MPFEYVVVTDGINPNQYPVVVRQLRVDDRIEEYILSPAETYAYLQSILGQFPDDPDFTITDPALGDALAYRGTDFVNRPGEVLNVLDFGAVGDGATDDTAAIQAAIDAAGTGNEVYLPEGVFKITQTLMIGDGNDTTFSTINAIAIVGAGMSWENGGTFSGDQPPGTRLHWYGPADGIMMQVNGPIGGVRIENLTFAGFTGTNPASALVMHHPMWSRFKRLMAQGFNGSAYVIDAYTIHPDTVNGANSNLWEQVNSSHFFAGSAATGITVGVDHTDAFPELDVSLNTFIGCTWYAGTGDDCTGILLQNTDNNCFYHCYSSAGTDAAHSGGGLRRGEITGATAVAGIWPAGNSFVHCAFFPDVRNDDPTWSGSDTFLSYVTGDGAAIPTDTTSRGFTFDGNWFGTWNGTPMVSESVGDIAAVPGSSQMYYDPGNAAMLVKHGDGTKGVLEGVRFIAGQGGSVTQITSKSTTVVLNKLCGQIITHGALLAADSAVTFTFTNSTISQTDVLVMNHVAGGGTGNYLIAPACGIGSATVTLRNLYGSDLSDALVINFAVIRAANS